jgi:hypothetical protein
MANDAWLPPSPTTIRAGGKGSRRLLLPILSKPLLSQ